MSRKSRIFSFLALVVLHLLLLAFCVKTNTFLGIGLDEARYIPAGLRHWQSGDFAPASDAPPLARMIAVLPLLPLEVRLDVAEPGNEGADAAGTRERELRSGGRFASSILNFHKYKLFCMARSMGFVWWLIGAAVIGRWAGELSGPRASLLAVGLWCTCPAVLAFEQQVTPDLPLAVSWAAAAYAFRGYLRSPSWDRAIASGLLLGIAQLIDFASLALFIAWPLLAVLARLMPADGERAGIRPRTRILQAIVAVLSCLWVINLGYEFRGIGAPLEGYHFVSHALKAGPRPPGEDAGSQATGNRFRGTWLGRVASPVPADYLQGLDRRLAERWGPPARPDAEGWPVETSDDPLATAAAGRPVGVWAMTLGSLVLLVGRRLGSIPVVEHLTLWLLIGAALVLSMPPIGILSGASGNLLTTPFAIVIASALAGPWRSGSRTLRWAAALLSVGAIGHNAWAIYVHEITPANRARFLLDVDKYRGRLGLAAPEVEGAAGEQGLRYRTFVDSRGASMRYALYVPRGYRGDRPYPLILFLHGYGDRGTDGRQFTAVGLPFTLGLFGIDFLVLCPQGAAGAWAPRGADASRAMELLAVVERDYRIDAKRVYLSGLSSGGTGVWDLAAEYPDRWAAIVPVASAPRDPAQAPRIKHLPCWCFHNRYDGDSPVSVVRTMITALRAAGGRPRYTEYLNVNHDAWDPAYQSPELFDWLARQRLP